MQVYSVLRLQMVKVKGKGFPYSLPSVGLDMIPVYRHSAHRWHPPGGRLTLLSARPAVTFPAAEHHRRHQVILLGDRSVSNLLKVFTQLLPRLGFEPMTCW